MLTLGIAGHVDHGKTSLVRALTGIETDRLPEEQKRGISIELGFAWLDLATPAGGNQRVALVDMPGHERFVRRMISGAAGIDAVLLCIAADEGVMPQGREHLAICRLLGVRRGAIVLTKVDLADAFMLDLVREELTALTAGTFLEGAPVWPVSVRQPDSVAALREQLAAWCATFPTRSQDAMRPFRMAIDRSFSLPGRGTIVAGTAVQGQVAIEDALEILPSGKVFRVRSIERHGQTLAKAAAPGRVALNLAAATLEDAPVGSLLATPGTLPCTQRFDARLTLLDNGQKPLPVRRRATVHLGTTQVEGTVVQLTGEPQLPGSDALVQIHLDAPLPVAAGEGFVVRASRVDPRHGQTMAGGHVLHPAPQRHRLADAQVLATLTDLGSPRAEDQVAALLALAGVRGASEATLRQQAQAEPAAVERALKALLAAGRIRRAGAPPIYLSVPAVAFLESKILQVIAQFHQQQDQRPGIEPEQVHRLVGSWLDASATAQVLAGLLKRGALKQQGPLVALPSFAPRAVVQQDLVDTAVAAIAAQGLAPPTLNALAETLEIAAKDLAAALQVAVAQGRAVRLTEELYVDDAAVQAAVDQVLAVFSDAESFSTGALKDLLGLTRKHLIPFAEYLDAARVTVRDPSGNRRVRDKARQAWLAQQNT